jgi:hypothetical protein
MICDHGRVFKQDLQGITWHKTPVTHNGRAIRWGVFEHALSPVIRDEKTGRIWIVTWSELQPMADKFFR